MIAPMLKIGGVEIALHTFPTSQEYSVIEGATVHRMMNGVAHKQQHWRRLGVRTSGDGWAPPALAGIDWSAPVEFACVAPRAIHSALNVATLPAARRSDVDVSVYAYAVVAGELVQTAVAVVANVATAVAVAGASSYQFHYYPKLSCYSAGPTESLDLAGAAYGWMIEAEEV